MNKRLVDTDVNEKRMLTRQEAANYLGVGLRAAREFCDSCHATRRIGTRVVFDRVAIDRALDMETPAK